MLFIDRRDGTRVRDLGHYFAILPYLMRHRNEASVYFSKDIDVEKACAYSLGPEAGGQKPGLFAIAVAAAVRTLALKPRLNRFVKGRAVYQRKEIEVSFAVKRKPGQGSAEASTKIRFEAGDTLERARSRLEEGIARAAEGRLLEGERRIAWAHGLPLGKAILTSAFRFLDRLNLASEATIRGDPLYTSVYFANLGSVGLDSPFHHLYDWGTASIYIVMGRIFQKEVPRPEGGTASRRFVNFKITVDERIAEGAYYAHAASLFLRLLGHPELLEREPDLSAVEA